MSSTPKMRFRPSASRARMPPSRTPLIAASRRKMGSTMGGLEPHVRLADEVLLAELGGEALHLDPAHLEQVGAIHELQDLADVLLDDQDGVALLAHPADEIEEAEHHDRRQAHGGLVEE